MVRALAPLCVLLLTAEPVAAQTCTPTRIQHHSGWLSNANYAPGATVPEGEVWVIERGGIASNDSAMREVNFQIEEKVVSQGSVCCWSIPIANRYATGATPKSAITGPHVLLPGDRLAARMNANLTDLALLYSGWSYPLACLPRVLGMQQASGSVDYGAFSAALEQAATALQGVVQAVP